MVITLLAVAAVMMVFGSFLTAIALAERVGALLILAVTEIVLGAILIAITVTS